MYTPSKKILKKYSDVLVNFALGGGEGIKKDDVVYIQFDLLAQPLALEVYRRVLENGAHPLVRGYDYRFSKEFFELANDKQLDFFPKEYIKSLIDTYDHRIYLIADDDPFYLKNADPKKIMRSKKNNSLVRKWMDEKEDQGNLTWTLALYGTDGMAKEANLSLTQFWNQINKACFLKDEDPIKTWKKVSKSIDNIRGRLSDLPIERLHLTADKTDLWITMGKKRKWNGGSGRNIPSFEIFTSPDWRGTNGHVYFDYPLYRFGNLIKGVYLEFKDGFVVKAKAEKNQKLLQEFIKQENADKIGEYSLTDRRHSHITKFMANTLYDENFGGKWGNTHLALGTSYHDTYAGNPSELKEKDWKDLGFNESPEHTDIMATTNRRVEAYLKGGKKKIIYKDGEFKV